MLEGSGRDDPALPWWWRLTSRAERALARALRARSRWRKRRRGVAVSVTVKMEWRLGDEIMALPVLAALRRDSPADRIVVRLRHPELVNGSPDVDAVNPPWAPTDRVIELRGEVPGEPRRETLARRARTSLRGLAPRVVLSDGERSTPALAELRDLGRPRVALHPRSTQPCKSWGRARWLELASALTRDGCALIEIGDEGSPLGVGVDAIGRTSIRVLARLLAQVDVVVSEDSGPLHLALAVGTPAVGVFGPTDPHLLYAAESGLYAVESSADCRYCWPRRVLAYPSGVCPLAGHDCMEAVTVSEVLAATRAALAAREESV